MTDLDELEKKAREATPGPWEQVNSTDVFTASGAKALDGRAADADDGWRVADTSDGITYVDGEQTDLSFGERKANATFISAANPSAITDLIARCRKAEARVAELEAQSGEAAAYLYPDGSISKLFSSTAKKLYLRAPQAVPEWQPIETAPEAQHVFVWLPNYGTARGIYTLDQGRKRWWNGEEVIYPTHWMPLPAAPSPEGENHG